MRIRQILKLLLLTGFLSGCWSLHIKDEAPGSLDNIDLLQSFIGQKSESVIRELGLPNELLSDGDKQFMVYSVRSSDTAILMVFWVPMPVWDKDPNNILHCLRIELDSNNLVKEYRVKSKVMHRFVLADINTSSNQKCRWVFWSQKELTKLQITKDIPPEWFEIEKQLEVEGYTRKERMLKKQAEKGNADAQLTLIYVSK